MARPPNLTTAAINAWGTGWNHAALVPAYGAIYAQQAQVQQYRHPYITVTQPTPAGAGAAPSMSAALSAAALATPLKRKLTGMDW